MENGNKDGYKVLSSKYLFRRPWLTVREDSLRLPDGRINPEYYILEYPDWVNIIAITKEGDFVMERQYRHGIRATFYEIPAGVIEKGESPLDAAKRELLEETGFGGGRWEEFMVSSPNSSTCTNMCHSFIARGVEKISGQSLDSTEDISVHILSRDEVFRLISNGEIKQAMMLAPLWKYFAETVTNREQ